MFRSFFYNSTVYSRVHIHSPTARQSDSSIVRQVEKRRKLNICLRCLNHFAKCVFQCLVREFERKKMKFKNLTHITYMLPMRLSDYRAVGLQSCQSIDWIPYSTKWNRDRKTQLCFGSFFLNAYLLVTFLFTLLFYLY